MVYQVLYIDYIFKFNRIPLMVLYFPNYYVSFYSVFKPC